jgi:hypothetical protein
MAEANTFQSSWQPLNAIFAHEFDVDVKSQRAPRQTHASFFLSIFLSV